uniref:Uncharacterized protein n=1 Tax=Anguilla anguilla TaxID=7936 RepID=A0A0E9TL03_ANGAN
MPFHSKLYFSEKLIFSLKTACMLTSAACF